MTFKLTAIAALTLLLSACASSTKATEPATAGDAPKAEKDAPEPEGSSELSLKRLDTRDVGDVYVHRFSGEALGAPIVLTEEVVDDDGHLLVVHYTVETAETRETLVLRRHARTWEIESVARLVDGAEEAATIADFEALLERTVVAADSNEGKIEEKDETCLVGAAEYDCRRAQYEVTINGQTATLTVTTSDELPGRDLGGVLESESGDILYRAELVEVHRGSASSVAKSGL